MLQPWKANEKISRHSAILILPTDININWLLIYLLFYVFPVAVKLLIPANSCSHEMLVLNQNSMWGDKRNNKHVTIFQKSFHWFPFMQKPCKHLCIDYHNLIVLQTFSAIFCSLVVSEVKLNYSTKLQGKYNL